MLSRLFSQGRRPLAHTSLKRAFEPLACDRPPKVKQARTISKKDAPVDEEKSVGSVIESDCGHWHRHSAQPYSKVCCRCNFIRNKAELQRVYPWLMPRPSFKGGHWRLGCDTCHWMFSNSKKERHAGRRGCKIRASTFSAYRFTCTGSWGKLHDRIKAHSVESGHRISHAASQRCSKMLPARLLPEPSDSTFEAASSIARPMLNDEDTEKAADALPMHTSNVISEAMSDVVSDRHILKGRVPQCQDWVDCWAESTEQTAFHKQARKAGKSQFNRPLANLRRIRRKQIRIIAEARRRVLRKQLAEARFISLSMDERQYQKIVRFRCDAPVKPFIRRGILGVLKLEKSAVGDFEEDHALIAVRKLDCFLNKFCTPLGKGCRPSATNFALKEHIKKNTRAFAADGASKERRALLLATQELFPNVVLLLRDSAHALRIAIKDPLHFDALFGEVWTQLFDKRHALVPDVMNSKKWQDFLQNIQREVLRIPCENRPLAVVLKHLRFAKQRFDSSADPIAKVAFMLLPLATMLAFISSDERHKPCDRARAKEMLKKLDSKFALAIGVCADWGLVTQAFIRIFDKSNHDIAKTHSEIKSFKSALKILFDQGGVFSSRSTERSISPTHLPAIGGYFGAAGVKPMFVTEHIEETLRRRVVFNCGDEQVILWGSPSKEAVEEIVERLKFVTDYVIKRVEAEFEHLKVFECFDVATLRAAYGCTDPCEANKLQHELQRHIRELAMKLALDVRTAALEYRQVAILILDLSNPGRLLATATSNEVWQAMLDPSVRLSHLPQSSCMQVLNVLIRFYISVEDGECVVERDLGLLKSFNDAHQNVNNDLAEDLLLAKSDPIELSDLCSDEMAASTSPTQLAVGNCTRLGPKSRRWAILWRQIYGARLGCYKTGIKRGKRPGTYTAAKAGVLAAAEYCVAAHMQHNGDERRMQATTPLGVSTSFLKSALGDKAEAYNNVKFKRFQALTKTKKLCAHRFLGRFMATYKPWKEKKAAKSAWKLENVRKVCYLGNIGESLPHPISSSKPAIREISGRTRGLHADLVVVDDLGRLWDFADDATVNQMVCVVGRGVPVITRACWALARGDPDCVPKESVIRYVPLAESKKVVFVYDAHFQARSRLLLDSLQALSKLPKSKWKVRSSPVSAIGDTEGANVALRASDGVDVLRSWIAAHRRIVNVSGPKAWSMTQPLFFN